MATGDNASGLAAIGAAKRAAAGTANIPRDALEGKLMPVTRTGDATWTTIVVTHGYTVAPTNVQLTPTSPAAGLAAAAYWVTKQATTFTVNLAAAPAAAAVVSFDAVVYI